MWVVESTDAPQIAKAGEGVAWPAWRGPREPGAAAAVVLLQDAQGPPPRVADVDDSATIGWKEGLVTCMYTPPAKRSVSLLKAIGRAMKMFGLSMQKTDIEAAEADLVRVALEAEEALAAGSAAQVAVSDYLPPWKALRDHGIYEDCYKVAPSEEWVRGSRLRPALLAEARGAKRRWVEARRLSSMPAEDPGLWDAALLAIQAYLSRPLTAAEKLGLLQTCQLLLLRDLISTEELAALFAALGAEDLGIHARPRPTGSP